MDKICIKDLKIFAHHGVFEHETINGQDFFVDAELYVDTESAGISDDLTLSVDYGSVCYLIKKVMTEKNYHLIEAVAQAVASAILINYPIVKCVEIEIKKPYAPIDMEFGNVSVKIKRSWHTTLIALGSNMGDSRKLIEDAVEKLCRNEYITDLKCSGLITTKPYGYTDQADFLNGAVLCKTIYSPHELLRFMQSVENEAGRVREIHWGPRTLDLDLIFYDNEIINTTSLIVPHPDMQNRDFVLKPACQLIPEYVHPILGVKINELLERLEK